MPRYEFSDGKSHKFWQIDLQDCSFTVCFGRIGTSGQTQTKSFATAEHAAKEYGKLVAEKLKKGYLLAGSDSGDNTVAQAAQPVRSRPKGVKPLRKDLYVYNEATGFVVTHKRLGGKGWDSDGKEWDRAVRRGDIIPLELVQDDPFTIRIVIGPLSEQEQEEWVGCLDWKLRVPDGNLVICGGSIYIMEEFSGQEDDYVAEFARHLKIPRGEYRASLYMYLGGVNGHACLKAAMQGDEPPPLGEWFRRSRPGEPFPAWLHNDCVSDPREDPGHEAEWERTETLEDGVEYVQFLLHLTPLEPGAAVAMPELADGWFSVPSRCQVPKRIPLGIPVVDIVGHQEEHAESQPFWVDVFHVTNDDKYARRSLNGTVTLPLSQLHCLYRLAWFCHFWAMPQIVVRPLPQAKLPDLGTPPENVRFRLEGDALFIDVAATGRQLGALLTMAEVSPLLAALPDGCDLQLDTVFNWQEQLQQERPQGLHRYQGNVRQGSLIIEEAFPVADAGLLAAALALAAQVDTDSSITVASSDIAQKAFASLRGHPYLDDNPPLLKDTTIRLKQAEPFLLNIVAAEVFRYTYRNDWPCFVYDPQEDEDEEDDDIVEQPVVAKGQNAPPRGEVILKGDGGRVYYRTQTDGLDADCQKRLLEVEQALALLGFQWVADVLCSATPYLVIRGYVQSNGNVWAALLLAPYGRGTFEFVEYFAAASLSSTQNVMAMEELFRDVYKNVRSTATPIAELWQIHQRRAAYLTKTYGPSLPLDASVAGLAADVEKSVQSQQAARSVKPLLLRGQDGRRHFAADLAVIDPDAPDLAAASDARMAALGFQLIGDVVSTFFSQLLLRGYLSSGGDVLAKLVVVVSTAHPPLSRWEFVSRFNKGAVLVSTYQAMSRDEPKRKIFRVIDPQASAEELLVAHETRKAKLVEKWGETVPFTANLQELAAEAEAACERILGG